MRRVTFAVLAAALLLPAGAARADGLSVVAVKQLDARLREYTLHTSALSSDTHVRVLLPDGYDPSRATRYPVLYLLHGCCDDYRSWTDKGDAEKITAGMPLIVVMPDAGQGGFYTDWYNGGAGGPPKWESYHVGQLIPWVDRSFPTVAARAGRALAGLSMGGFGAMTYAARHPDMFVAAASFSGAVDNMDTTAGRADGAFAGLDGGTPDSIWGSRETEAIRWRAHNPVDLAENLRGMQLTIRTGNGQPGGPYGGGPDGLEMGVHEESTNLHDRLDALKIPHVWQDYGPGAHSWPYWERDLRLTLPDIMNAFAHPPAPPSAVTFTAVEPTYEAYGWHVALTRPALEFSRLENATAAGFTLAGTGAAKVTTPALYAPGSVHGVTSGEKQLTLTADSSGALTIPVDLGPADTTQEDQPEGVPDPALKRVAVTVGAASAAPTARACSDRLAPRATAHVRHRRLSGTARDRGCSGVARVEVSVARPGGGRCRFLDRRGRLGRPRVLAPARIGSRTWPASRTPSRAISARSSARRSTRSRR